MQSRSGCVLRGLPLDLPGMRCPDLQELPPPELPGHDWPFTASGAREPGTVLPRITIVIPSFNQGRYLEAALRSVLLQDYPDLELIVMDGGSTDQTVPVIRKYERWISQWVSETDDGQSSAINQGFRRATGEIFAWIGCDDRLLPGALARVGAHFAANSDAEWLAGAGRFVYEGGRVGQMASCLNSPDDLARFWLWSNGCFVVQSSAFWRRRLWEAVGGVREDLHLAMDYDLWLKFAKRARLHCVSDVLSVALRESGGKTFEQPVRQRIEAMRCAYEDRAEHPLGALALNVELVQWYIPDRLRRGLGHFLKGEIEAGVLDCLRVFAAPIAAVYERGRLAMITH